MQTIVLAESYVAWHYGRAYADMYRIWMNFFWFVGNFFSVSLLFKTFLQPWKRMDEGYQKGFDPGNWISTLIVNIIMRIVGMMVRSALLIFALALALCLSLAGILIFAVWTIMPVFVIALTVLGLYLTLHG